MFGIADFSPFLIPIGVGLYLLWLVWTRPGEPNPTSATVQYDPPENLTPGECGALLENAVDVRCITATIVDLSVKGYLTIDHSGAPKNPGEQGDEDYYFHLTKPLSEWKNLKPHEWQIASAIFIPTNPLQMLSESISDLQKAGAGNPLLAAKFAQIQATIAESPALRRLSEMTSAPQPSAGLSELRNHFPLHLARIRKAVFDALQSGGYYASRPDQIRLLYTAKAVTAGLAILLLGALLGMLRTEGLPWILSAFIAAIMIWGAGLVLPARSAAGMRALGRVRGFKDFLARVEKDRLEKLENSPRLFEKYLPYAMALGVDRKWAEAFARIAVPPPQWYRGKGGNFFPTQFVSDLNPPVTRDRNNASRAPGGSEGSIPER